MSSSKKPISPLRQRMLEDMRMRKLSDGTQRGYIRAVKRLAGYLGRSPDTASIEDLRRFQLHLVDQGVSPITLNATITGLKFFFDNTLGHPELMAKMQPVYVPRTLPVVLSCEEVSRLILAAPGLKYQTALSIAYAAGLRASEVVRLKVSDIDSERSSCALNAGKARKTAMRCCHRSCLGVFGCGGGSPIAKARCPLVAGCSPVTAQLIRSPPASSTGQSMPPPRGRSSTSASQCIR